MERHPTDIDGDKERRQRLLQEYLERQRLHREQIVRSYRKGVYTVIELKDGTTYQVTIL